jgi:N-acetylneuraminic acid mutarotase
VQTRNIYLLSGIFACGLFAFTTAALPCRAQTINSYEWTWMGGSDSICTDNCGDLEYGHLGVYGMLGVPAPGNLPGSRFGAVTWTDKNGNLWLFGGQGVFDVVHGSYGNFNDLWEFSPATKEWTWLGGSTSPLPANGFGQPGLYGTQGAPAAGNIPGGRNGALGWIDHNGHLWLFGGYGSDSSGNEGWLNDFWEFNPATNEWAWMGGSSTMLPLQYGNGRPGVYGTLGTPAAGNVPGSHGLAANWTDNDGNLWMFGGGGFDANGNGGDLNDLWEFNPATNEWAWMGGSSTRPSSGVLPGVYGTLGRPAAGNTPGERERPATWTDSSGNLWLFGGAGLDANATHGWLNDLWKFNPQTKEWAWMGGSSTIPGLDGGQPGTYGTMGTPAAGNVPGARDSASRWTDNSGNFWLLGGSGFDTNGHQGELNDLWEFNPSTNQWVWITGSSTLTLYPDGNYYEPGVYGALGMRAAGNLPGSRNAAMSWTDSDGYFWLFGGWGYDANGLSDDLNDVWRYQPPSATAPTTTPVFSIASGTYTAPQSVTISDATPGATIYYTSNGTPPTTSSSVYSAPVTVTSTETLEAMATASGYSSSDIASATYTITPPPSFTVTGTTVSVIPGATTRNTSTITLTPSGGFTGVVNVSCAITPPAASDPATCSVPPSVTISSSMAQTATLTVSTTAPATALKPTTDLLWPSAGTLAFTCVVFIGIPAERRRWWKMLVVVLFSVAGAVLGCGGSGNGGAGRVGGGNPGTTPGSYVITVTGTSGNITQTETVSLTVQ